MLAADDVLQSMMGDGGRAVRARSSRSEVLE
jgi:hypothetical protein